MTLWTILILAIVQGAAELLPVSSSAHVIFASKLLGIDPSSPEFTFLLVMLHTGTMFAAIFYFFPGWKKSLTGEGRNDFVLNAFIASACTGVLGLILKFAIEHIIMERLMGREHGEVESLFRESALIAAALFCAGVLILLSGRVAESNRSITRVDSVWIGLVQGLCLPFRGFSRSGATISTALFRGIGRITAEEFSFALAVLLTPAAIALELRRLLKAHALSESAVSLAAPGMIGMLLSFLSGLIALRFLSRWLEQGRWGFFGYYCIAFAAVILIGHYQFGL